MNFQKTITTFKIFNKFLIIISLVLFIIGISLSLIHAQKSNTVEAKEKIIAEKDTSSGINSGLGYIAIALATGLSTVGAGIAVSNVGSAAIGSITEKPELFGRALIFVGLAEGIAIYGLVISILILTKL